MRVSRGVLVVVEEKDVRESEMVEDEDACEREWKMGLFVFVSGIIERGG